MGCYPGSCLTVRSGNLDLGGYRAVPSIRPGGFRAVPSGRLGPGGFRAVPSVPLAPEGFRAVPSVLWWPELPDRAVPSRGALELGGFRAIPSVLPSWAAYLGDRAIP